MKCKGCKDIEWVADVGEMCPSEVPRCTRLNREITYAEYNTSAPRFCPYRDSENLGRGADERHVSYLVDERDHYKALAEKYRGALNDIWITTQYQDNEDDLWSYVENNLDDVMQDYRDVVKIAKQALQGDEK